MDRGERHLKAVAQEPGRRRGQEPRRRLEHAVDSQSGRARHRERDLRLGPRHPFSLGPELAAPVVEGTAAGQLEREVSGIGSAHDARPAARRSRWR